jgi:insertion element IS1 protein InsB
MPNMRRSRAKCALRQKKTRLTIACDELWSFVGKRRNKVGVWLAQDYDTGEIIAVHLGKRSRPHARHLWQALPPCYRQCAVCYTDAWHAYQGVLPAKRHRVVSKAERHTNRLERFNHTLRQRLARFVRKSFSFSKKFANHLAAVWDFVHHYNASLPTPS